MAGSPLEQFTIKPIVPIKLGSLDVSFSNSAAFMAMAVLLSFVVMAWGVRRQSMVPGRLQSLAEILYEFVSGMLKENVGEEGRKYLPFVFSLFMFVLLGNLMGMIPYGFTYTSHIVVTFGLAFLVFVAVTVIGLIRHGFHFFSLFVPHGAPWWLLPIIVPIEVISYMTRPISLSVRLFANMLAGHTMMKVFAGFVIALGFLGGWLPLAMIVALTGFELGVAMLQAYVFSLLTCIYLKDAIHLH
ncbi:MAG: F0F1 ATP synthase subunit A [Elsteraceae bacterium]